MAYPMELRRQVLAACAAGHSTRVVAQRFGLSERTVRSYQQRQREGRLEPQKPGPRRPTKLTRGDHQHLRELIKQVPEFTLRELAGYLEHKVTHTTVYRALRRMGLVHHESPPRHWGQSHVEAPALPPLAQAVLDPMHVLAQADLAAAEEKAARGLRQEPSRALSLLEASIPAIPISIPGPRCGA